MTAFVDFGNQPVSKIPMGKRGSKRDKKIAPQHPAMRGLRVRERNGREQRETVEEARATVHAQRVKTCIQSGINPKHATCNDIATPFGIFCIKHRIDPALREAALMFREVVRRARTIKGFFDDDRSPSESYIRAIEDMTPEERVKFNLQVQAAQKRMANAFQVLRNVSFACYQSCLWLIVEQRTEMQDVETIKSGLIALADHFKIAPNGQQKPWKQRHKPLGGA